jgi:hypothetical protein
MSNSERPKLDRRKAILVLAAAGIVVSGLFPPWLYTFDKAPSRDVAGGHWEVSAGFRFFFDPPVYRYDDMLSGKYPVDDYFMNYAARAGVKIDFWRLVVEWVCILAVSGAAWGVVRLGQEQPVQMLAKCETKPLREESL